MVLILATLMGTFGCGNDKTIKGVSYGTYGVFTLGDENPKIHYRIITGNVIWSILLIETVVFPVYFIGFSLWEPVDEEINYVPGRVTR